MKKHKVVFQQPNGLFKIDGKILTRDELEKLKGLMFPETYWICFVNPDEEAKNKISFSNLVG